MHLLAHSLQIYAPVSIPLTIALTLFSDLPQNPHLAFFDVIFTDIKISFFCFFFSFFCDTGDAGSEA